MRLQRSASIVALIAAGAITPSAVGAQQVVVGPSITISPSSANVLNLLGPYLGLNATSVGQATLTSNLSQAIAVNNSATTALQQLGESDENLLGSGSGTTLRTAPAGGTTATLFGVAANLGGGLPTQAIPAGGTVVPMQAVGGLGAVLGAAYANGVNTSLLSQPTGPLFNVTVLLNNAYTNFTSPNLGVAKNYFANGGANNTSATLGGVTTYMTNPAVAPAGYTLPTANGLPNTTNSVYDLAANVTNKQAGQDVYGSSRPVQVASTQINSFDPTALSGLNTNPSFPSGHTTYAYTDSILLAMLVPQEYQSMLYRGSAYANSRIVVGVHYPLDIIASRALASYDLSQALTNPLYINNATTTGTALNLPANFTAASAQITPYLTTAAAKAGCGTSIAACAASAANTANDPYVVNAANAATYTSNLTYGLPTLTLAQAPREAAPAGGPDASILLEPIFGGSTTAATAIATATTNGGTQAAGINGSLSTATINQIIVNTETTALAAFYGTSLSYWTRIDLAAAAGYFGNVVGGLTLAPTDRVTTSVSIGNTGVLEADGSIAGMTTVNAGGTLLGNGTVAGVNVLTGGTLAPGSAAAIGTLNVSGPLVFAAGSTYAVRATPTQADNTLVTGTATLGGANVAVTAGGNFLPRTRYNILTAAGGVTGTFGAATSNLAFLTASLSYDSNDAYLTLSRNDVQFQAVAATQNQRAVGIALTNAGSRPTNDAGSAILNSLYTLSAPGAQAAYNQLSGEGIADSQNTNIRAGRAFNESIGDQLTIWRGQPIAAAPIRELADLPTGRAPVLAPPLAVPHYRVWGSGFGGAFNIDGNAGLGTAREQADFFGGEAGADAEVQPGLLLGGALGGSGTDFSVTGRASSGQASGFHAAVYGAFLSGANYLQSTTSFSDFSNTTNRNVGGFGGGVGIANERASFGSTEIRERVEAGDSFSRDGGFGTPVMRLTPFAALEFAQLTTNGFSEYTTNGVANVYGLQSFGHTIADVPGFVGARIDGVTTFAGYALHPVFSVAYLHEFAPERNLTNGFLSLPGATFLVQGARVARNAAQTKLGAEATIGAHLSAFVNFDGEFSGVEQVYSGKGGLRYTW